MNFQTTCRQGNYIYVQVSRKICAFGTFVVHHRMHLLLFFVSGGRASPTGCCSGGIAVVQRVLFVERTQRFLQFVDYLLIEGDLFCEVRLNGFVDVHLALRLEVRLLGDQRARYHVGPMGEFMQLLRLHLVLADQPLTVFSLLHSALQE